MQELEEGPHRGPYLRVYQMIGTRFGSILHCLLPNFLVFINYFKLEGAARYAGLLLAAAEVFGGGFLYCFGPFLVILVISSDFSIFK